MKKLIFLFCAALSMTSCGALMGTQTTAPKTASQNTTANTLNQATNDAQAAQAAVTTPSEAGMAAGKSVLGLYNQYKADGKYDYTNISNISNTLILMANIADLPSNVKNKEYMQQFGSGLMTTAASLITPENVEQVTGSLTEIAGAYAEKAASAASGAAEKLATAAQTANAVYNMLSLFK